MSPELKTQIITIIGALAGVVVGGFFTYFAARVGHRWEEVKKDVAKLCDQVAAFHRLEKFYSNSLAEIGGKKEITVLKEMRDKVEKEKGLVRPDMTEAEAKRIKERWS